MVRYLFLSLTQQTLVVALALLFANAKPVSGTGTSSRDGCTLRLGGGSVYFAGLDINTLDGVTYSTAGTLTCEAVLPNTDGPCQGATISNCLSVVCERDACINADLSTDVDSVECKDGSACIGTNLPQLCALFRPDGTVYVGAALANLHLVEFDANTNTLTCKAKLPAGYGKCESDAWNQPPTISGCSKLICEDNACHAAQITGVPSIECNGWNACQYTKMTELPNDALVKCVEVDACLVSEITTAGSSSGARVICDGENACGVDHRNRRTSINVDCLECRSSDACLKGLDGCLFNGETCLDGPQGSCPCSLTTSTGEIYLERDINTLTDVSYDAKANSILCEGQTNGLCRGGTIMACPTVECSTQACKGTTAWKPNDLDCVGQWACREAVLKNLTSGATASCNGDRACVDAEFTTERGGVTVDCIGDRACLRATLDDGEL